MVVVVSLTTQETAPLELRDLARSSAVMEQPEEEAKAGRAPYPLRFARHLERFARHLERVYGGNQ